MSTHCGRWREKKKALRNQGCFSTSAYIFNNPRKSNDVLMFQLQKSVGVLSLEWLRGTTQGKETLHVADKIFIYVRQ